MYTNTARTIRNIQHFCPGSKVCDFYTRCIRFESRPRHYRTFSMSFLRRTSGRYLKIGHHYYILNPFMYTERDHPLILDGVKYSLQLIRFLIECCNVERNIGVSIKHRHRAAENQRVKKTSHLCPHSQFTSLSGAPDHRALFQILNQTTDLHEIWNECCATGGQHSAVTLQLPPPRRASELER
jgi:hypothetical protein